jgi:hypothetical protein
MVVELPEAMVTVKCDLDSIHCVGELSNGTNFLDGGSILKKHPVSGNRINFSTGFKAELEEVLNNRKVAEIALVPLPNVIICNVGADQVHDVVNADDQLQANTSKTA